MFRSASAFEVRQIIGTAVPTEVGTCHTQAVSVHDLARPPAPSDRLRSRRLPLAPVHQDVVVSIEDGGVVLQIRMTGVDGPVISQIHRKFRNHSGGSRSSKIFWSIRSCAFSRNRLSERLLVITMPQRKL